MRKLEDFLIEIIYHEILVKIHSKFVYVCQDINANWEFVSCLAELMFNKFEIGKLYFFLSNSLPLYITQEISGVVIEVGFGDTRITPIYEGYALIQDLGHCQSGGNLINCKLRESIFQEQPNLANSTSDLITHEDLEDFKFKFGKVLSRVQREKFFTEENIPKMK